MAAASAVEIEQDSDNVKQVSGVDGVDALGFNADIGIGSSLLEIVIINQPVEAFGVTHIVHDPEFAPGQIEIEPSGADKIGGGVDPSSTQTGAHNFSNEKCFAVVRVASKKENLQGFVPPFTNQANSSLEGSKKVVFLFGRSREQRVDDLIDGLMISC